MLTFSLLFFFKINLSLFQAVKNVLLVVFSCVIFVVSLLQELLSNAFAYLCIKSEETRQSFTHLKVLRKLISFYSRNFFRSKHRRIRVHLCQCVCDVVLLYSFFFLKKTHLKLIFLEKS